MSEIVFTEGSGLNKSVYGEHLYPIRLLLETQAEAYQAQSILPLLFNMETSQKWAESLVAMTSMQGPLPVGEGGDYPTDGMQQGFDKTIKHMTWKTQFEVTEEMVEDSQNLNLRGVPEAQMNAWYRTRELFGARMFGEAMKGNSTFKIGKQAFNTLGADGKRVFATDHGSATGRGASQTNLFSNDFSADALTEMETRMHLFKDDNGNILNVAPRTIVIPEYGPLKQAVFAAIGADKEPTTGNNAFNFQYGRWNVVIWPYLNQFMPSGDMPWMLLDPNYNKTRMGAVWFDRKKLTIRQEIGGNDNLIHKLRARWGVGFNDWRFCAVGGITGGTDMFS